MVMLLALGKEWATRSSVGLEWPVLSGMKGRHWSGWLYLWCIVRMCLLGHWSCVAWTNRVRSGRCSLGLLARGGCGMGQMKVAAVRRQPFVLDESIHDLTRDHIQQRLQLHEPMLLRSVFEIDTNQFLHDLMHSLHSEPIEYDVRLSGNILHHDSPSISRCLQSRPIKERVDLNGDKKRSRFAGSVPPRPSFAIETYTTSFETYLSQVPRFSSHEDSLYFLSETLLQRPQSMQLLRSYGLHSLPNTVLGQDWFSSLPQPIRPRNALVICGAGARSFLHRDPFDWIGWNLLLEGMQLWYFLACDVNATLLDARHHRPESWNLQEFPIASGQLSDRDLFHRPVHRLFGDKHALLPLQRDFHAQMMMRKGSSSAEDLFQRYAQVPLFLGDTQHSSLDGKITVVLQKEGEVVLIPPGLWHQVYHLQPCIALASQHCAGGDLRFHVLDHILKQGFPSSSSEELTHLKASLRRSDFVSQRPEQQFRFVIHEALRGQFGEEKAVEMIARLFP